MALSLEQPLELRKSPPLIKSEHLLSLMPFFHIFSLTATSGRPLVGIKPQNGFISVLEKLTMVVVTPVKAN
jgi:hypothetical protein